jgi:hypothetical protein
MNLIRLILFFIFMYLVVRLVIRMVTMLGGSKSDQVRGKPRNSSRFKDRTDIEDADYEELK